MPIITGELNESLDIENSKKKLNDDEKNEMDISSISNKVVRVLLGIYPYQGGNVTIINDIPINLTFTVENKEIKVLIYDDYYIYDGKKVNIKEVKKAFIAVYNAN